MKNCQNFFNRRASCSGDPIYSADWSKSGFQFRYQLVVKFLRSVNQSPDYRLLDCGCGAGSYLELTREMGVNSTGVDFSYEMLKRVRAKGIPCSLGEIEKLPFKGGAFDIILSIGVLQYLDSAEVFFAECSRALKPGGRLFITTLFSGSLRTRILQLLCLPDKSSYDLEALCHVLKKNNFKINDSGYLYVFPKGFNYLALYFNKWQFLDNCFKSLANVLFLDVEKLPKS